MLALEWKVSRMSSTLIIVLRLPLAKGWSWRRAVATYLITQCLLYHNLTSQGGVVKLEVEAASRTLPYSTVSDTTTETQRGWSLNILDAILGLLSISLLAIM